MPHTLKIRETVIGERMPKICVPLTGKTAEEVLHQAEAAAASGADLVEWRADCIGEQQVFVQPEETLGALRRILGECPLIFTVRTGREGGNREISTADYADLLRRAAGSGLADVIDVEVETAGNEEEAGRLIREIQETGAFVLASNHHFEGTPSVEEMASVLLKMEREGADILKIAVMPENSADVLALLRVTEMVKKLSGRPLVTMSMGRLGLVSRLSGEVFGSAITFGTVGEASAPGQIPLEKLRAVLSLLHGREA